MDNNKKISVGHLIVIMKNIGRELGLKIFREYKTINGKKYLSVLFYNRDTYMGRNVIICIDDFVNTPSTYEKILDWLISEGMNNSYSANYCRCAYVDGTEKRSLAKQKIDQYKNIPVIEKVIFNDPATVVIWRDATKTVVKAENEPYDPEKGLAMAISKKALGNEGNYYETFKKWLPEVNE